MLDSREVAPLAADKYMFVNTTASPSEGKQCDSNNLKRFEVVFRTLGNFFLKKLSTYRTNYFVCFCLALVCLSLGKVMFSQASVCSPGEGGR